MNCGSSSDPEPSQPPSDACHPLFVVLNPFRVMLLAGMHRPELEQPEGSPVLARSLLHEQHWSG